MKSLTIRLPDALAAEIEQESRKRDVSKSDIVLERLHQPQRVAGRSGNMGELIGDLIGSVTGLPSDLSSNKKKHLQSPAALDRTGPLETQ